MADIKDKMRLDKWLWAARFYKTRSVAATEIDRNRVMVNDQFAKPARDVRLGDKITLQQDVGINAVQIVVIVQGLSNIRGPALTARTLYQETQESIKNKEVQRERRRFMQEPSASITDGRPTKKDRRQLTQWKSLSDSVDE